MNTYGPEGIPPLIIKLVFTSWKTVFICTYKALHPFHMLEAFTHWIFAEKKGETFHPYKFCFSIVQICSSFIFRIEAGRILKPPNFYNLTSDRHLNFHTKSSIFLFNFPSFLFLIIYTLAFRWNYIVMAKKPKMSKGFCRVWHKDFIFQISLSESILLFMLLFSF